MVMGTLHHADGVDLYITHVIDRLARTIKASAESCILVQTLCGQSEAPESGVIRSAGYVNRCHRVVDLAGAGGIRHNPSCCHYT